MKKELTIKGKLLLPITVGAPAYVRERLADRTTSTVQRILERNDDFILFETKNTVYRLMYERKVRL